MDRLVPRTDLVRQVTIGLSILAVLACTLLGSGVLTIQESAYQAATSPTATEPAAAPTLPTWTPEPTSTATRAPIASDTPTPPPATASTPPTPIETRVTPMSPTQVPATETATATATETATATATETATAMEVATTVQGATPTRTPTKHCIVPAYWRLYVVQSGDTLTSLAQRHGTTVTAIMGANCLNTTTIYRGQPLYLPALVATATLAPTRCQPNPPAGWAQYTVQAGDTLYTLAQRHQTTLLEILRVNCLPSYDVHIGQKLFLPQLPPTPTPTWTLVLSATSTPSDTGEPTTTTEPTSTLEPTPGATATLAPEATPTSSSTPQATSTPLPSATVAATPVPTATSVPTDTPVPTTAAAPTATTTTRVQPMPDG